MRKSLCELIEAKLKTNTPFLQIITKEPYVVSEAVVEILLGEKCSKVNEIIYYDILQGFDVPTEETCQQKFAETIDKWLGEKTFEKTALIIKDSDLIFGDEKNVFAMKKMICDKSSQIESRPVIVIVISEDDCMPLQLKEIGTIMRAPFMTEKECKEKIEYILGRNFSNVTEEEVDILKRDLLGLTEYQVEQIINEIRFAKEKKRKRAIYLKAQMLKNSGLMSLEDSSDESDLGGFEQFKEWIRKIKPIPNDREKDIIYPKGILLVGVTGCGKSLAAKVAAGILDIPLLRIDFGNLMSKYVGESEKNLCNALQMVESMAPCVLWMDEFEKAFGNADHDNGVTQRMLGQFLTWMQERKKRVLTIATVNNVSKLPPELLRRGRFDKIYYVDLPDSDMRKNIIKIHSKKVGLNLSEINISNISSKMQGKEYSGADIEYIMKEAAREKYSDINNEDDEKIVLSCMKQTIAVGTILSTEIKKMRNEFTIRGFDNVNG